MTIIKGSDGRRWYQHPGSGRVTLLGPDREPDPPPKPPRKFGPIKAGAPIPPNAIPPGDLFDD